jgi:hypothetical protein
MGIPCIVVPTRTIVYYFAEPAVRFVPPDDPTALAAVIVELYGRPEVRAQMARDARAFYNTYNFETQGHTYMEIIRGLAEHRAPALESA